MKIVLFDIYTSGHHIKYASFLINFLVNAGHEVIFITSNDSYDRSLLNKIEKTFVVKNLHNKVNQAVGSKFKNCISVFCGLMVCLRYATKNNVDIVHCLYLDRSELPLALALLITKKKWKLYGTLFWTYFLDCSQDKKGVFKKIYHGLNRWLIGFLLKSPWMNGLFVHTEQIKTDLEESYRNKPLLNKKIHVIPDPVEELMVVPHGVARDSLGLPKDANVMLFIGGIRWDKGPDIFIKALSHLEIDIYALMAGTVASDMEKKISIIRTENNCDENMLIKYGYLSEQELAVYYAAADLIILPYRRVYRGTSGVLQNAASVGKPVIVSDVGYIGPIVKRYKLGFVVQPESSIDLARSIEYFFKNKDELTENIKPFAAKYAENNDWKIMAKKVNNIYMSS